MSANTPMQQKSKIEVEPKCLLSAAADMMRRRSATACSHWVCSLLASTKAFSAFFALPSAAFCDFSTFALAVAATS
jgi:hypothetical protein